MGRGGGGAGAGNSVSGAGTAENLARALGVPIGNMTSTAINNQGQVVVRGNQGAGSLTINERTFNNARAIRGPGRDVVLSNPTTRQFIRIGPAQLDRVGANITRVRLGQRKSKKEE